MNPPPVHRLHALLEAAAQRLKMAARVSVERTVESLGLAALAANSVFQRDAMLGAQFELNRKSAMFALAFGECLDDRLRQDSAPRERGIAETAWDALGLVEDTEVERKISADRFGLEVQHACEWELRELEGYMGSLLGPTVERNPLRPETVGLALLKGIEAVSDRADVRSLLQSELGRVLALEMRGSYAAIVGDLRKAGVQPAGLSVRSTADHGRHVSGYDSLREAPDSLREMMPPGAGPLPRSGWAPPGSAGYPSSRHGSSYGQSRYGAASTRSGRLGGASMGHVEPQMMSLIRQLAHLEPAMAGSGWAEDSGGGMPANLIRAHRDELRRAAGSGLDHMVIDVIGTLFDQILSDPKVPPQMARQIARLQLPVLRAALGDPSFFSSRKHPVRRFVNRIASLGAAFDDFEDAAAQRFLARVKALVNDIVEGDFDQIDVYDRKLGELEGFVAEQAQEEVRAQGDDPAALLGDKETALRLGRRYAEQLAGELKSLVGHDFVREFLTEVWSRVLVQSAMKHGADGERFQRLRAVARDLYMSVQPKGTPQQRKEFLAALPRLMQGLNEGMDLVAWPAPARKAFFGKLLPAHAESLKAPQTLSTLDWNLLARQVEGAFQTPLPKKDDLPPVPAGLPVLDEVIDEPRFTAEEAKRIGLVDESRIDWHGAVDIDLSDDAQVSEQDVRIAGLPAPEPLEPTRGKSLVEHVELGYPYQMHVDGSWQKVKLTHVSPGRTFFVFTHGKRHKQTISLTHRMLARLCENHRFKAFENAYLLERATARARRQLSAVGAAA
ncbi:DUF1631 family protein [Rubrivivax albus]|uniref:DUF1631 family protein n=1 Tax=Rubrivivax albus TaxID=2499835 RepID=A0A437K024_9BURK|nr:DUF1631 family protein [Rubrivivax albus]RVT53641.1 DUF1631 family protein [Rubrivivax albus]